jgi:DNA polymerase III sliding clamp (beta) subunit (PCNA family)
MMMVVTLTKKQANEIAKSLGQVMPRKVKVPVLGHVLFEPEEGGRLQATATDLEQTLAMRLVPEKLEGAAARFLFPMAELKTLGKSMPRGGTVTLQPVSEDSVVCTMDANGQPVVRTVATMPVEEFPEVAVSAELAECDLGAFLRAYRGAAFAASSDPGRLVLHAVYADQEKKVLVATDGHRLTRHPLPTFPFATNAILPLNKVLLKHLPESDQGRIGLHEKDEIQTLVLATDELTYSCRCPEGRFPNYEQVIPDMPGYAATLSFGPADLEAIGPLVPFLDKADQHALFVFGRAGQVTVGVGGDPDGGTVVPLPECRLDGEDVTFAVNGKMLLDALKHGFLTVRIRDGYSPVVFDNGNDGLHLLMPLRPDPSSALQDAAKPQPGPAAQTPTQPIPEEDNPMPAPETTTPETEKPGAATPPTTVPNRNLELVEAQDPVARLEELVAESQESIKQANASGRELKKQIRAVKTHYRDREKQVGAREKEMEKSLALIQRLQETIAA